jgi:nucleotide-binding universal stress UspA family protein
VKQGDVEAEIVSTIQELHADMVIMGTHGRGLVGRTVIGSVTQHMLRKLPIPILTVCHVTRPPAFERILFATDLSESSTPGFSSLLGIAGMTRSRITLLHAVDTARLLQTSEAMITVDIPELRNDALSRLNVLAARAGQDVKTETLVVDGHPSSAILKSAEDNCSDLIAITVGKKGLIERALLGSTAERVIRDARIPVLAIPVS